jgi:hypothetical protein
VWLERLEYADDAALINVVYEMASKKVTELARASQEMTDIEISRPKTEYMAIRYYAVPAAMQEDYDAQVWQFTCADCGRGFPSKHGLTVHRGAHCK